MSTVSGTASGRLRQPRLADMIADQFRTRIVSGQLAPGERLPRQELLAAELGVSLAVVREALRLLEAQDLITVHRGKFGGASVRLPSSGAVSSPLATVAAGAGISAEDVGATLVALDSLCAQLCAALPDRTGLVATLQISLDAQAKAIGNPEALARECLRFHQEIVRASGLATLAMIANALAEAAQVQSPAVGRSCDVAEALDGPVGRRVRKDHARLLAAIADADAWTASAAAAHARPTGNGRRTGDGTTRR